MVVARYGGDGLDAEGLFFLPGAEAPQARIVLNTGDEIPEANGTLEGLGLVDLDENGAYVMQAYGDDPLRPRAARQARQSGGVLFQGNVNQPREQNLLLSACPSLELSRSARARSTVPIVGDNLYGPRIGGAEVTSYVTQLEDDLKLYRNDSIIAQSGALSPGGSVIRTLIPGVVNGGGLTFFQLITERGIELCANDGTRSALLLQRGDLVEGRRLDTLALGFHNNQADDQGGSSVTVSSPTAKGFAPRHPGVGRACPDSRHRARDVPASGPQHQGIRPHSRRRHRAGRD
jgi:hypothetical protein